MHCVTRYSISARLVHAILIFVFAAAVVLQLYFLTILKARKTATRSQDRESNPQPVSIIICARNEAENLRLFLPAVLEQHYPAGQWEVILIDDQSTDGTTTVLQPLQERYPQLRVIPIPVTETKTLPGKKYALAKGITAARFERLLLTDADCRPSSPLWLFGMTATPDGITLGYGAYETRPGLLNRFIRWETAHTCMQYMSYAAVGKPYMGVGRNLSYNRSLQRSLEQDTAFQEIYRHTPSGDDDLLISRMARPGNTFRCLEEDAFTISLPQATWKAWWKQKTRHSSTGKYYPVEVKRLLGLYALSHSLYWFLGLPLFIGSLPAPVTPLHLIVFLLFPLRLLAYWLNAAAWFRQLNEKKILFFYPFGDLGWAIYNVFLSPYIFWKNKQAWK